MTSTSEPAREGGHVPTTDQRQDHIPPPPPSTPAGEGRTRFRKKPVVIEALQFDGTKGSAEAICMWANALENRDPLAPDEPWVDYTYQTSDPNEQVNDLMVSTIEGHMRVSAGDWVIRGVKGEFYPCKPYIFEQTYEPFVPPPPSSEAEEARQSVSDARLALFAEMAHSWRCHYEDDPERPGKRRRAETVQPGMCECYAVDVIADFEAAIRAEATAPLQARIEELEATSESWRDWKRLVEQSHEVAGGWKARAEKAEAALHQRDEALRAAESALSKNVTTWIALEPSLSTPYADDQRWTPWTRFGERAFRAAGRAHEIVKRALNTDTEGEGE